MHSITKERGEQREWGGSVHESNGGGAETNGRSERDSGTLRNSEALSQTVKFERNCHLAEPLSDALPEGVIRTHRAIEAESEDAPIRPHNSEMCM